MSEHPTVADAPRLFERIGLGQEWLWWSKHPLAAFAGHVTVHTQTGWVLTVFIDCNEWDYVQSVRAPDGSALNYDDLIASGWACDAQSAVCDNWKLATGVENPEDHAWPPPPGPWPEVRR